MDIVRSMNHFLLICIRSEFALIVFSLVFVNITKAATALQINSLLTMSDREACACVERSHTHTHTQTEER